MVVDDGTFDVMAAELAANPAVKAAGPLTDYRGLGSVRFDYDLRAAAIEDAFPAVPRALVAALPRTLPEVTQALRAEQRRQAAANSSASFFVPLRWTLGFFLALRNDATIESPEFPG